MITWLSKIKSSWKTILAFYIALFFILTPSSVIAQSSPEEMAKKYGVGFPISELGNCADFSSCRDYCDEEANLEACVVYAKKKGFHKENQQDDPKKKEIIAAAQKELGCSSEESCREACSQEANFANCQKFASKHGLGSGPQGDPKLMQNAKNTLGCDSEQSCKAICENPANQEKCSDFAKQHGLRGGERRTGPGGCNSEQSCTTYCQGHEEECSKFGGGQGVPEGKRAGPGGCNSEQSCTAYCNDPSHSQECGQFGGRNDGGRKFSGPGGCTDEASCRALCEKSPEVCGGRGFQQTGGQPPQNFNRPENCPSPEQCSRSPEAYPSGGPSREGPESGEQFQSPPPGPTGSGENFSTPPESGESPTIEVRGASTTRSLLQLILDTLLSL